MQAPKLGGKKVLRLFLKGNNDLVEALCPQAQATGAEASGLRHFIRRKYGDAFAIEILHEPCGRSDLLLQHLGDDGGPPPPSDPIDEAMSLDPHTRLGQADPDVIVLSLQPEVAHTLWRHRRDGFLLFPAPDWEQVWPAAQREGLRANYAPVAPLSAEQFKATFTRLVRTIKARLDAHVLVFNCSTIDPADQVHNYHGLEDTLAVRVHRFNLALYQISTEEGISIIDVDRLVAELGADRHVVKGLHYSAEAYRAIGQECFRVLEDIGFFEARPLIPQIGHRGG